MATSNPKIHLVRDGVLLDHTGQRICDLDVEAGGHTAWRQWSRNPDNRSFNFESNLIPGFQATAIKEKRKSGSGSGRILHYWFLNKRFGGNVVKQYCGSDRSISLKTIENAVRKLVRGKIEDVPPDAKTRQAWQQARRQIRRRPPAPRREMPEEPKAGEQLQSGLW